MSIWKDTNDTQCAEERKHHSNTDCMEPLTSGVETSAKGSSIFINRLTGVASNLYTIFSSKGKYKFAGINNILKILFIASLAGKFLLLL